MDGVGDLNSRTGNAKVNWKRLFVTLAVGCVPTAVSLIFGWWWVATVFLLLTLFVVCFAFASDLYPVLFTLYAVFAIMWLSGSLLDEYLPEQWGPIPELRSAVPWIVGALLGLVIAGVFWSLILFVSTKWILSVSDSFGIPWRQAFRFVATQVFQISQSYLIIENGEITVEKPRGILSRLGGPGVLVVRPGNAVVLERGGKVTRIVGPGVYRLERFEALKQPAKVKGIVDLHAQWGQATASNVLTQDGIPLKITFGVGYQIEPKRITDRRPSSHFEGGEATTLLFDGEHPVYRETVRRAVFETTEGGWKGLFPSAPIAVLRDMVGAYTLDQIFASNKSREPDPDARAIKSIEDEISRRLRLSWAGVWLKTVDILEVNMPENIRQQIMKRWTTPVERDLKLQEAMAERDAMIQLSEGRARSLERMEQARVVAWKDAAQVVEDSTRVMINLVEVLTRSGHAEVASTFIRAVEQLTLWFGYDESTAMRYVEAMEAAIQSEGTKTFVFSAPSGPGTATPPAAPPTGLPGRRIGVGYRSGPGQPTPHQPRVGQGENQV